MQYLLDTNICIYIIKEKPVSIIEHFRLHSINTIGVSSITIAELEYGIAKSSMPERNRQALSRFLLPLTILNFDGAAALKYGAIRAALEKGGKVIGPLDMLIAAQALSQELTLVTNNESEFKRVPGLHVENWI